MILFAGFEGADLSTSEPVSQALQNMGLQTSSLTKKDIQNYLKLPSFSGALPNFPFRSELLQQSAWLDSAYRAILPYLSDRTVDAAAELLSNIAPKLTVLCPGHWESLAIREACRRAGGERLFLFPTYFEFKTIQPFSIPNLEAKEAFLLAGEVGAERLITKGVDRSQIKLFGAPAFDAFISETNAVREATSDQAVTTDSSRPKTVLFASQSNNQDQRLLSLLVELCLDHPTMRLVVRRHPVCTEEHQHSLERIVRPIEQRVLWSKDNSLQSDLSRCDAVISHSSTVLLLATILGKPAISWNSSTLPDELTAVECGVVDRASSLSQLQTKLFAPATISDLERKSRLTKLTGPLGGAAERVANYIAGKVRND